MYTRPHAGMAEGTRRRGVDIEPGAAGRARTRRALARRRWVWARSRGGRSAGIGHTPCRLCLPGACGRALRQPGGHRPRQRLRSGGSCRAGGRLQALPIGACAVESARADGGHASRCCVRVPSRPALDSARRAAAAGGVVPPAGGGGRCSCRRDGASQLGRRTGRGAATGPTHHARAAATPRTGLRQRPAEPERQLSLDVTTVDSAPREWR